MRGWGGVGVGGEHEENRIKVIPVKICEGRRPRGKQNEDDNGRGRERVEENTERRGEVITRRA